MTAPATTARPPADDPGLPIAVGLGRHIATVPAGLDHELRERAQLALLDTVGCMIGASTTVAGRRVTRHVAQRGASGKATVVGAPGGRRSEDAVLANATLGHMLELDDGHRPSDNHLGCVVVPSALALAEELDASPAACLDAIVLGYDVMGRVGEATLLPRRKSPFHGTGTTGVFGAAAVAARLLRLDPLECAHALAIAGTSAAGLRESTNTGPDCKPLHAGRAAHNGIAAAFLASAGYEGPLTVFEGAHGFCTAMCDEPRPERICADLGRRFAIVESGFKVHSTCGMLFNLLDGVLEARAELGLDDPLPTALRVGVPSWVAQDVAFARRRPRTAAEARFSIPFAVAAAIVDGEVSPRQMTDDKLASPTYAAIEDLVEIDTDPEVERIFEDTRADPFFFYPAAIEVTHAGRVHRSVHTNPLGYDPNRPLQAPDVIAKFRSVATVGVSDDDASAIVAAALGFAGSDAVASVTRHLPRG